MQPKTVEVIYVRDLQRTKRFYEALGYALQEEQHGNGPLHYSVDFGTYLWEFYPAKNTAAATQPSEHRRLFIDTADFETVLKLCGLMNLDRDPVTHYDKERLLRSMAVEDPDGWRINICEVPKPSVH